MSNLDDLVACGYLSTDPDGTITHANHRLAEMTGVRREDLVGQRRFHDLLTVGGRIFHDTHLAPILLVDGRADEVALELQTASGERLPVLINAVLERDERGAPASVHIAVFDAHERRSYEQQLLEAKRAAEASERRAIELAHALQATLIPPAPPTIEGLDIAAAYRPAGDGAEVGGDFFYVFEVGIDDWVVAVGDVSGKGVEAAIVTSYTCHALRELALRNDDPAEMLAQLNRRLLTEALGRHCTLAVARLRRAGDAWHVALALGGHHSPLLLREGRITPLGRPGTIVGALRNVTFTTVDAALRPGDCLVLTTDGVHEARHPVDGFLGDERVRAWLDRNAAATVSDLVNGLVDEVVDFQAGWPRDDVVVVGVRVPDPPA